MQERIQGILARTAPANPVAADEARRMGEREDAALPDDPDLTHAQAVENLRAAFPDAEFITRLKTEDGR